MRCKINLNDGTTNRTDSLRLLPAKVQNIRFSNITQSKGNEDKGQLILPTNN